MSTGATPENPDPVAEPGDASVRARGPELAVGLLLMVLAALVIHDSLRVGRDWADDGPKAGYFPFYIGSLLLASSAWVVGRQVWHWSRSSAVFAAHDQLSQVVAIFVPMCVYLGLMIPLGLYVPSVLLIAYFMKRHGDYGWPATTAVSVGVPLVFFLIFERWFLVPLPKGPIERALGL